MDTNDISACERLVMKVIWDSTEDLALQDFVVYQNDFKEILMKQPIAIRFAETEKMLHLTNRHGCSSGGRFGFSV